MKEFNDFLKTVDMEEVTNKAIAAVKNNAIPEIANFQASAALTINLLRQYHEWLNQ